MEADLVDYILEEPQRLPLYAFAVVGTFAIIMVYVGHRIAMARPLISGKLGSTLTWCFLLANAIPWIASYYLDIVPGTYLAMNLITVLGLALGVVATYRRLTAARTA